MALRGRDEALQVTKARKHMLHLFADPSDMQGDLLYVRGSEVNHIRNVCRLRPGDEVSVSTGRDDLEYRYGIEQILEDEVILRLRFTRQGNVELPVRIYLFQALPKADKMELIIQKAVELGVYAVIPVSTARCVVRLDEKKAEKKTERWQKIAEAAAMQSRRAIVPEIYAPMNMQQAAAWAHEHTQMRVIPYELQSDDRQTKSLLESAAEGITDLSVFIGPEGGFEPEEIALARQEGIRPISLGRRILRTETAGLAFLSWMIYILEIG